MTFFKNFFELLKIKIDFTKIGHYENSMIGLLMIFFLIEIKIDFTK